MSLLAQLAADLLALLHALFVLFVVLGGVLVLRRPRLACWHLPAALWGALIEFTGWTCPLTPLENRLRRQAGGVSYDGDFLARCLGYLLYPDWLTREVQWGLGAAVLLVNGLLYALFWRRGREQWLTRGR